MIIGDSSALVALATMDRLDLLEKIVTIQHPFKSIEKSG
jgi:hypothetical protein